MAGNDQFYGICNSTATSLSNTVLTTGSMSFGYPVASTFLCDSKIIQPQYVIGTFMGGTMVKNDRVKIREGYEDAGSIGYYVSKSNVEKDVVIWTDEIDHGQQTEILAASLEAFPYTPEERVARSMQDMFHLMENLNDEDDIENAVFAIIEAGY